MAVGSTMVPLGTLMPEFVLTDVSGHQVESTDLAGTPALVMFLCNHCPYVRHAETRLGEMLHEFADLSGGGDLLQRRGCLSRRRTGEARRAGAAR